MQDSNVLLEIEGLRKNYGRLKALDNVSLEVKKGEVVVLLGPSGCGKSTLLRCLNGLERVEGGDIKFKSRSLTGETTNWQEIRQQIGMVFQNYELFPHMNVIDNILLGPIRVQRQSRAEALKQARGLLDKVGLLHRQYSYPRQLSGGQRQRVAIVRALCMSPEIMLFDEVTASLDPEMVREVLNVILSLAREGMTMIIVTHEISFAHAVAHRVVFMDEGKICEISKPDDFFRRPRTERAKQFLNIFQY